MQANGLDGKVAVVTGAASGIGLASSEAMIAQGATVVLADRDQAALARAAERLGPRALTLVVDLLDTESCASLIPSAIALAGRIDILYCNAGTYIGGDLSATDAVSIDRMLNLNVNAVIKNVHAVVPHMIERGSGDILVTSSLAGHSAIKDEPVYSASKFAMTCFVQTMRRQLNGHGIRVGQVSPGPVASALLADWPAAKLQHAKDTGAIIEPSEVAEAVVFSLTRPRTVTIRDIIILPTNVDA